jgi:hypothetical protein
VADPFGDLTERVEHRLVALPVRAGAGTRRPWRLPRAGAGVAQAGSFECGEVAVEQTVERSLRGRPPAIPPVKLAPSSSTITSPSTTAASAARARHSFQVPDSARRTACADGQPACRKVVVRSSSYSLSRGEWPSASAASFSASTARATRASGRRSGAASRVCSSRRTSHCNEMSSAQIAAQTARADGCVNSSRRGGSELGLIVVSSMPPNVGGMRQRASERRRRLAHIFR